MRKLLLILFLLNIDVGFCQQTGNKASSTLIESYLAKATGFRVTNPDSMYYYAEISHRMALERSDKPSEAQADLLMGISYIRRGDLYKSLKFCEEALALSQAHKLKDIEATALDNIGLIHNYEGNYPEALAYYQKSLRIAESIKNKNSIAGVLINIGGVYYNLKEYDLALDYWEKSLAIQLQFEDQEPAGSSLNNIGLAFAEQQKYDTALTYFFRALSIYKPDLKCRRIYPYENMGGVYLKMGRLDSAEFYLTMAFKDAGTCNNQFVKIGSLTALAEVNAKRNRNQLALQQFQQAYEIGVRSGLTRETGIVTKSLAELYEKLGNTKEALANYKIYHTIQENIYNSENGKALGKLEAKFDYERALREQEISGEIEKLRAEKEITSERWIRNTFIGGFLIMIFVAFMVYRNFRRKKQSNLLLQSLNNEIREQQKVLINQAEELLQLNESLNISNQDLEQIIADRTQELTLKNTELANKNVRLEEYGFINAHKLRAPVATILGLVTLFSNKNVGNEERDEIVSKIRLCSEQLDGIVKEIREILEKEKLS
jgi:tetratricopeptide (TPR) repeat protein